MFPFSAEEHGGVFGRVEGVAAEVGGKEDVRHGGEQDQWPWASEPCRGGVHQRVTDEHQGEHFTKLMRPNVLLAELSS